MAPRGNEIDEMSDTNDGNCNQVLDLLNTIQTICAELGKNCERFISVAVQANDHMRRGNDDTLPDVTRISSAYDESVDACRLILYLLL